MPKLTKADENRLTARFERAMQPVMEFFYGLHLEGITGEFDWEHLTAKDGKLVIEGLRATYNRLPVANEDPKFSPKGFLESPHG